MNFTQTIFKTEEEEFTTEFRGAKKGIIAAVVYKTETHNICPTKTKFGNIIKYSD